MGYKLDGGAARYMVNGKQGLESTNSLAFNVSAANAKIGLDALDAYKSKGITSTFSATPLAASHTITLDDGVTNYIASGLEKQYPTLSIDSLSDGGVVEVITAHTVTTAAVDGFTAGTYYYDVFIPFMRRMHILPNGKIKHEDFQN